MPVIYLPDGHVKHIGDELLPDSRVKRIWDKLRRKQKVPDDVDVQFATYVQPPRLSGLQTVPEMAVFAVVSPNPHKRYQGKFIQTLGGTPLVQYRQAERERMHYVARPDPAEIIFAKLLREHMVKRQSFKELN